MIPSYQPRGDCPIEIPLQLPSCQPLSTSASVVSKDLLMQQSDVKAGVSQMRPGLVIGVGGDSQTALGLNHNGCNDCHLFLSV